MSNLFHFLNVKNGDCSIIEHGSGHVTIVDVCNARLPENAKALSALDRALLFSESEELAKATQARKNYQQKTNPVNPIEYLNGRGIASIFRFAVTHPDMDHMDGLTDLFEYSIPINYYDTENNKEIDGSWEGFPYRKEDWDLYKQLRDTKPENDPKVLRIFSGDDAKHRTRDWDDNPPGDSFYTLSPTPELVAEANDSGDYNDSSYVFLWNSPGGKIVIAGDSHDKSWNHILNVHEKLVSNVELLIAPHHGRKSGRSYEFLDVLNPKLTFFGNAPSKDLAYSAWRNRGLHYITNNMAGSMIVDCNGGMIVYVSNESYARDENRQTFFSEHHGGWFLGTLV